MTINEWFNSGRNWEAGLQLYLQHGTNARLKSLFQKQGPNLYNQSKLADELEKLRGTDVPVIPLPVSAAQPVAPAPEQILNPSNSVGLEPEVKKKSLPGKSFRLRLNSWTRSGAICIALLQQCISRSSICDRIKSAAIHAWKYLKTLKK